MAEQDAELLEALDDVLNTSGARGEYNALKHHDAVQRAEAAIAAARGNPARVLPNTPCTMGVGCDEYGVCYADAHNQPEQCPHYARRIAELLEALEAIQLHASNHSGWVEHDAWGGICYISDIAGAAIDKFHLEQPNG